jgi:asparagine synthase (glutamine-hydrolysing)
MPQYVSRVVDLLDPSVNRIFNMSPDEARARVLAGTPDQVRAIDGSFALVASEGITVRMARSLDRPMRYFLAKRHEGPALYVADRIDALHRALEVDGLADQFHPTYTRMIPAHYVVEIALVGCPDPDPIYTRFFTPPANALPTTLDEIGARYVQAMADQVSKWLQRIDNQTPSGDAPSRQAPSTPAPIGVAFSGGIDSGAVFLVVYHTMLRLGMSPARLKAFVLNLGNGPDVVQAREFLSRLGLSLFLEEIDADPDSLDVDETLQVLEDYKPLDVQCAAMGLALCRGIRTRYPEWRYLADGDGGDENLKDYPIEENHELTIRSVIDNLMLYQEGWGVGRIKHSLTYTGGLSRSYARTYAPARKYGFDSFSPYAQPPVIEVAEGIPFAALTSYDVPTLYALKGEIVSRGIKAVTGFDMPVFPKRRFQHGALPIGAMRTKLGGTEQAYRRSFHSLYA